MNVATRSLAQRWEEFQECPEEEQDRVLDLVAAFINRIPTKIGVITAFEYVCRLCEGCDDCWDKKNQELEERVRQAVAIVASRRATEAQMDAMNRFEDEEADEIAAYLRQVNDVPADEAVQGPPVVQPVRGAYRRKPK
jgi:hypothetical protein